MSLQYVVYDYWDYGYAVGDAILEYGASSITATADVSIDGIRIRQTTGAITASASISADAIKISTGSGSITASADVTAFVSRIRDSSSSISVNGNMVISGSRIRDFNVNIDGVATFTALGGIVKPYSASINCFATVVSIGSIVGEEWVDVAESANIWINLKKEDPYVEVGYWVDGYTTDIYDEWNPLSISIDSWTNAIPVSNTWNVNSATANNWLRQ